MRPKTRLRYQLLDYFAEDVGEAEVTARIAVGERFVIKAEQLQNSGVEVVHVNFAFGDAQPDFIRRSVNVARRTPANAGRRARNEGYSRRRPLCRRCRISGREPEAFPNAAPFVVKSVALRQIRQTHCPNDELFTEAFRCPRIVLRDKLDDFLEIV
jgi:hypothetical protein